MNPTTGLAAAKSIPNATFHRADVTDYASLGAAFESTFKAHNKIDFVFANAGIVEKDSFYATHETIGTAPPPPPNMLSIDIDLKAVVSTAWLAQHYFRLNKQKGGSIVMTSSVGGLYAVPFCPMYSGAKHGVLGFMRSIAGQFYKNDGIRVNAICPGNVRTNILTEKEWDSLKDTYFTPVENVIKAVENFIGADGKEGGEVLYGKTAEISGDMVHWREQAEFMDEEMKKAMGNADIGSVG
jgi:NAD(P)-dependent dehydrogenase (short-subunit alcohol dehydrogenase family)